MDDLYNQFIKALQGTSGLANNSYLVFLKDAVKNISDASQTEKHLGSDLKIEF